MKNFFFLVLFSALSSLNAQISLDVQAICQGQAVTLGQSFSVGNNEQVTLETARFYLCNFQFLQNGKAVFTDKNCHLVDLSDPATLNLKFKTPKNLSYNAIKFNFGTDSLTNVVGVQGGDLDPAKGMFWTWQSGYVNFKLEGTWQTAANPNRHFEYHLGGFLPPNATVQTLHLSAGKGPAKQLKIDLMPFFQEARKIKKYGIMSPGAPAVQLCKILSQSFSLNDL